MPVFRSALRDGAGCFSHHGIDPPSEVESALAAINTAYNQVSSDISLAQAGADQKIVQSGARVEIETLRAQAEVEPLARLAAQLTELKQSGTGALAAYLRNVRLTLREGAKRFYGGQEMIPFLIAAAATFFAVSCSSHFCWRRANVGGVCGCPGEILRSLCAVWEGSGNH